MSEQVKSIQDYLELLREELVGSDPALVQDALYDAEEFLRHETAQESAGGEAGVGEAGAGSAADALERAVQRFGSPREVAEAYRENDARVSAALRQRPPRLPVASFAQQALRIFVDPRAYGALLYMFLSLVTGILYFVWAVTGLSLSLGLSVLIFGVPFALLFLASIRMFSLLEGRIVESLLGVRMPRRPPFSTPEGTIWTRFKGWLSDRRTWTTLLYMVLKLPLGIVSFTLFVTLASISLALVASPFLQVIADLPIVQIGDARYYAPIWAFPLFWAGGLLDLLLMMHLARALGRLQGALAKSMLVRA